MDDDSLRQMRQMSRQHIQLIWELGGLDESGLSDEDRGLLEAMRLHPEYYDLWERVGEVSEEELERDGVNPVMHLVFHQTVENQIARGEPPETAEALDRLMSRGRTRHEAVHEIGAVLAEEMFEILKNQREYDNENYVSKLGRLGRARPRRKLKSAKARRRGGRS